MKGHDVPPAGVAGSGPPGELPLEPARSIRARFTHCLERRSFHGKHLTDVVAGHGEYHVSQVAFRDCSAGLRSEPTLGTAALLTRPVHAIAIAALAVGRDPATPAGDDDPPFTR